VLAVSWIAEHVSNLGCEIADTVAQNAEVSNAWIFTCFVRAKMLIIFVEVAVLIIRLISRAEVKRKNSAVFFLSAREKC
jgi:hypothetical protein